MSKEILHPSGQTLEEIMKEPTHWYALHHIKTGGWLSRVTKKNRKTGEPSVTLCVNPYSANYFKKYEYAKEWLNEIAQIGIPESDFVVLGFK